MKLIRRKRKPTPTQQGLDILKKVVRGLAAVRVARTAFKTYKFARHLPQIAFALVLGGAVFAAARRLKQRGAGPETETWSPSTSPAPSPPPASSAPVASAATNGGGAPIAADAGAAGDAAGADQDTSPEPELHANPAETAATGTPPVELAEAGEPPHVEPADDLPAAGTADAAPPTDIPELADDVASDAVPAPEAEPGPSDKA
jgi:hypothetical protein